MWSLVDCAVNEADYIAIIALPLPCSSEQSNKRYVEEMAKMRYKA